jgi:HSP20 family molecular chaperone IbpA
VTKKEDKMKREVAANGQQADQPAISTLVEGDTFSRSLRKSSEAIAHRAYELFENDGRRDGHDLENWYRAESQFLQSVPLEIVETSHTFTVRAYITGLADKPIELHVASHRLVISGKNQLFDHRSRDVRPTEICRILDLDAEIEPSKVTARFIKGGLEIILPKAVAGRNGPTARKAA